MTVQTDVHYEVTDTFGGEANYSWVKRGKITLDPKQSMSDLAVIRRVKKEIEWNGARTITETHGDSITLRPRNKGILQVVFINFHEHGSAS